MYYLYALFILKLFYQTFLLKCIAYSFIIIILVRIYPNSIDEYLWKKKRNNSNSFTSNRKNVKPNVLTQICYEAYNEDIEHEIYVWSRSVFFFFRIHSVLRFRKTWQLIARVEDCNFRNCFREMICEIVSAILSSADEAADARVDDELKPRPFGGSKPRKERMYLPRSHERFKPLCRPRHPLFN